MQIQSGGLQGRALPLQPQTGKKNQSVKRHFTSASADVTVWTHLDLNSEDPYLKMTFEPRGV